MAKQIRASAQLAQEASRPKWLEYLSFDQQTWLRVHRWIIPGVLVMLVVFYEYVAKGWILAGIGQDKQILADILVFGTIGPVMAFVVLELLERWWEERETSDLQAEILDRAREDAKNSRDLNDDAIQVLFSASTLINVLKESQQELPPELEVQIEGMERALDESIRRLRKHLMR